MMNYQMIYVSPSWPHPQKRARHIKKSPEQERNLNYPGEEERIRSRSAHDKSQMPADGHWLIFPEDEDSDDD